MDPRLIKNVHVSLPQGTLDLTRKPDFFIVGAPRCGTTAMYEYLRQHPEVFMPGWKEPHFFGSDLRITSKLLYHTPNLLQYLALFSAARHEKRAGEASTLYLKSVLAASEIKALCPSARIIIMLRNPVDVLYSLHSHLYYHGTEDIENFEWALEAEEDRKRGLRIPKGCGLVDALLYRDVGNFAEQVKRYLNLFSREKVHIIVYDDFKEDTPQVYADVLRFLEVSPEFRPDFENVYENRRIRSRVLRGLWANRPAMVNRVIFDRGLFSRSRGIMTAMRRIYSRAESRPPMEPALRQKLQAEFHGEVARLSELLGRDLTRWTAEWAAV